MPLYEMLCSGCSAYFEIACERDLDPAEFICVDCGMPEVSLIKVDNDLSTRINNLILAVQDIADRIEILEGSLEIGSNPIDGKVKKKTVN